MSQKSYQVERKKLKWATKSRRDEEHEIDYCYGPDTDIRDVHDRTAEPLLHKFLEGYNTAAVVFGATGVYMLDATPYLYIADTTGCASVGLCKHCCARQLSDVTKLALVQVLARRACLKAEVELPLMMIPQTVPARRASFN